MVGLNPVLRCLMAVEEGVSRGDAVRDALLAWLGTEGGKSAGRSAREFEREVLDFLRQTESHDDDSKRSSREKSVDRSIFRQTLFGILESGVAGGSILPQLKDLRQEIEEQLELDMKAHVESLPLKMLIPLLLCMFPAFLILLLGPITQNFMEALK